MSSVPDNSAPEHAVEIAYSYLGLPYVFGGGDLNGPTNGGFDRAGFTRRVVYAATGTDIGRTLDVQLDRCTRLPAGDIAQPGDILFWTSPGGFSASPSAGALYRDDDRDRTDPRGSRNARGPV